jgi:hypothetical protein
MATTRKQYSPKFKAKAALEAMTDPARVPGAKRVSRE